MSDRREEFLSEEELDLRNLSQEEFDTWWWLWFRLAQATNDLDAATYSHGVFARDPAVPPERTPAGRPPEPFAPAGSTP